ncbi:MAG: hypothetical protein CL853_06540 [Crocinitomicaceae bacterium]|nr:hypothetical protein [Crocinitomicaceae bacterium]
MKKSLLILTITLISFTYSAQVYDSVFLQSGYTNQSYYNLNSGEVANVDNENWDLAFSLSAYGSSIRINGKTGTELYVYPNGDTSSWSSVDISGIASWTKLYDSDTSWSLGAFDASANPGNPLDLGWGVYNTVTHHILGDSLHVIKLSNGDYKKLQVMKLAGGTYEFRYANIDGSNEVNTSVSKSSFTNKNFGYYSIQNQLEIDREPDTDSWHLVFTKYVGQLSPGLFYGVTGVLSNKNILVAQEEQVDVNTVSSPTNPYQTEINTIGYDWKSYSGGGYVLESDLCYFIKDANDDIWKIFFTGFEGGSTGKIVFGKEALTATNTSEIDAITTFAVYPNPTTDNRITVLYDVNSISDNDNLFIYNLNGELLQSHRLSQYGFNQKTLSLSDFSKGIYLISLRVGNDIVTEKLIIQ